MNKKKTTKDFIKFLVGGIIWTGLSIFLAWVFIDVIRMYAFMAAIIITVLGIVLRFYLYVFMGLIQKQFMKFVSSNLLFSLLLVILMTISIDVMKVPTLIATPIITVGLFVFKFIAFIKIKLIK
ncbi:hypothetical protein JYT91_00565 [archaeon AH-315-M20]|nr:hypothetical protein [archaeon AH-315-M20]